MTSSKPWYKSRLMWVALVMFFTGGIEKVTNAELINDSGSQWLLIALGVIVAWLRLGVSQTIGKE